VDLMALYMASAFPVRALRATIPPKASRSKFVPIPELRERFDDHMAKKKPSKVIRTREIVSENVPEELIWSPWMQLYIRFLKKRLIDESAVEPELAAITKLPLEERYVWRVASALKWSFADFDSLHVCVDRETLPQEELQKLGHLLRLRPAQFCLFLQALFGTEQMERLMKEAITLAKEVMKDEDSPFGKINPQTPARVLHFEHSSSATEKPRSASTSRRRGRPEA
jgi:hypothetical protein